MFCFLGSKVRKLLISEYLDKILPWKEMKLAFPVKSQTESHAAQTKNVSKAHSSEYQGLSKSKKSASLNDYENIVAYS